MLEMQEEMKQDKKLRMWVNLKKKKIKKTLKKKAIMGFKTEN